MKKTEGKFSRILSFFIAILMIASMVSVGISAAEGDESGTWLHIKWYFDASEKTITISPSNPHSIQ